MAGPAQAGGLQGHETPGATRIKLVAGCVFMFAGACIGEMVAGGHQHQGGSLPRPARILVIQETLEGLPVFIAPERIDQTPGL